MSENANAAWDDVEWDGDFQKVTNKTYFIGGFSNVVAFETVEGVVLIDTGVTDRLRVANQTNAAPEMASDLRKYTDEPIHTVVYTHGHVDHVHGLDHFLKSDQGSPIQSAEGLSIFHSTRIRMVIQVLRRRND